MRSNAPERRSVDDPLFSDVFTSSNADEPSKNSKRNIFLMPVYDTPVYNEDIYSMSMYDTPVYNEDIFYELPEAPKNSKYKILSMPVHDKPVYDEDILSMSVYDKLVYDEDILSMLVYDKPIYDEMVIDVSVPYSMVLLLNFPAEAPFGSHVHGPPCSWTNIYAANSAQTLVHVTLVRDHQISDHASRESAVLKASLHIAAFSPLIIHQAGDGN